MYICTKDRYILLTFTVLKLQCGSSGITPYFHITPINVVHSIYACRVTHLCCYHAC